jgi:hypothetical protein
LQKAIALSRSRSLCKIKSNIVTTKPLDDWKSILPKSSLGIKDDFLSSDFGKFLAVVVLMGNLCWFGCRLGHLGWYQLKI